MYVHICKCMCLAFCLHNQIKRIACREWSMMGNSFYYFKIQDELFS
jgi:hypothetical protein